jgi:hypothetical protein
MHFVSSTRDDLRREFAKHISGYRHSCYLSFVPSHDIIIMSDSAALKRNLKIKGGAVKR